MSDIDLLVGGGRHLRFRLADMLTSEQELPVEIADVNRVQVDLKHTTDTDKTAFAIR